MEQTQIPIYYNPENKIYYSLEYFDLECDRCNKLLDKIFWIWMDFSKKESVIIKCCRACLSKNKPFGQVSGTMQITLVKNPLPNSYRVFPAPPPLVDGKLDNFSLALTSVDGEEVIDKTRHCHNPDFMKMPEYDPKHIEKMQSRIMELDNKATDDFFDKTISAQPVFDDKQIEEKKKQLEAK